MILFKREYHRFIEVYHWSWMQAVSTFTFLTTSKWNPLNVKWYRLKGTVSKNVIFINFPEFAINYPDSLLSYGILHP